MPRLSRQGLKVLKLFVDDPGRPLSGAEIMKATGLSSGTLYPLLLRFEGHGLFTSRWEKGRPEDLRRPRQRFYSITGAGHRIAAEALAELGSPVLLPAFGGGSL